MIKHTEQITHQQENKEYFKMSAKDLINWGELSRMLSGSRQTVRKNSIPKIHEPFVTGLLKAINEELSKLPDTAKAKGQKENKTCTDVD